MELQGCGYCINIIFLGITLRNGNGSSGPRVSSYIYKHNMEAYKPIPVVNLPPLRFIGGLSKHIITGNMQGVWDPDISVAVVTAVGVSAEEALFYIGMNTRSMLIRLECDCGEYWLKSLEEIWKIQSVNQWVDWLTRIDPEDEVPNID